MTNTAGRFIVPCICNSNSITLYLVNEDLPQGISKSPFIPKHENI